MTINVLKCTVSSIEVLRCSNYFVVAALLNDVIAERFKTNMDYSGRIFGKLIICLR